jgi:WD40 repeat protein
MSIADVPPLDLLFVSGGLGQQALIEDQEFPFSSDGNSIYFASDRTGAWQVWRQPVEGGAARQITTHGGFARRNRPMASGCTLPNWTPAACSVFLSVGRPKQRIAILAQGIMGRLGIGGQQSGLCGPARTP